MRPISPYHRLSPADNQSVNDQNHDRAQYGGDKARAISRAIDTGDTAHIARQHGAGDAQQYRYDASPGIAPRHDEARERAGKETKQDPTQHIHGIPRGEFGHNAPRNAMICDDIRYRRLSRPDANLGRRPVKACQTLVESA